MGSAREVPTCRAALMKDTPKRTHKTSDSSSSLDYTTRSNDVSDIHACTSPVCAIPTELSCLSMYLHVHSLSNPPTALE